MSACSFRPLRSPILLPGITNVTARSLFFCYTAVNAFATVCSLSGDPEWIRTTSAFPARRVSSANFIASGMRTLDTVFENLLGPSRKKTIE